MNADDYGVVLFTVISHLKNIRCTLILYPHARANQDIVCIIFIFQNIVTFCLPLQSTSFMLFLCILPALRAVTSSSCFILSHSIPYHIILPYRILSHSSYPILSYLILSYPISSYTILSYLILSYLTLSYPILSYPILSYLTLSDNSLIATTSGDCSLIVMEVDLDPTRDQPGKLMKRSEGR